MFWDTIKFFHNSSFSARILQKMMKKMEKKTNVKFRKIQGSRFLSPWPNSPLFVDFRKIWSIKFPLWQNRRLIRCRRAVKIRYLATFTFNIKLILKHHFATDQQWINRRLNVNANHDTRKIENSFIVRKDSNRCDVWMSQITITLDFSQFKTENGQSFPSFPRLHELLHAN